MNLLLQNDSVEGLKEMVEAFKAALIQTGNAQEVQSKYLIKGSTGEFFPRGDCAIDGLLTFDTYYSI